MTKEIPQQLQAFLDSLQAEDASGVWSFTVYSTYPNSTSSNSAAEELLDNLVCERFQTYIESNLRFTVEELYGTKVLLEIDFIRLPSVSIQDARKHFRAKYGWPKEHDKGILKQLREHYGMRFEWFVVIDEETRRTILDGPEAVVEILAGSSYGGMTAREDNVVIKIVDADYDENSEGETFSAAGRGGAKDSPGTITFYGYVKTTPRWLQELWTMISFQGVKVIFEDKNKVYKGYDLVPWKTR